MMSLYILFFLFHMDLHIKAYHLNHWLLSLYAFKYLHYSVTLSSRGWNSCPGVWSDLDLNIEISRVQKQPKFNELYIFHFFFGPVQPGFLVQFFHRRFGKVGEQSSRNLSLFTMAFFGVHHGLSQQLGFNKTKRVISYLR